MFSTKAVPGVFMGYSLTQKGYKIYNFHSKSFFVSRNIVFKESVFPFLHASFGSPLFPVLELPFVDDPQLSSIDHTSSATPMQGEISSIAPSIIASQSPPQDIFHILPNPDPPISRKSTRIRHSPAWMNDFITNFSKSSCSYPISSYVTYSHLS